MKQNLRYGCAAAAAFLAGVAGSVTVVSVAAWVATPALVGALLHERRRRHEVDKQLWDARALHAEELQRLEDALRVARCERDIAKGNLMRVQEMAETFQQGFLAATTAPQIKPSLKMSDAQLGRCVQSNQRAATLG